MRTRRFAKALVGLVVLLLACQRLAAAADAADAAGQLRSRYEALRPALAQSPFGRPLLLEAGTSAEAPHGDVFALLDAPMPAVVGSLRKAQSWCDVLMLQTNIKRCSVERNAGDERLDVGVARKYTDAPSDAKPVQFRYTVEAAQPQFVSVQLAADEGPVGTTDYRLQFSATPIDERRSFVHLAYGYETSFAARLATSAYLASAGRDKIGFSVAGRDASGRPTHVGGVQGIAERNTMRYFLAIEAFLDTLAEGPEARWRRFHAALERYPAQLHETELDEYLEMKRREASAR